MTVIVNKDMHSEQRKCLSDYDSLLSSA